MLKRAVRLKSNFNTILLGDLEYSNLDYYYGPYTTVSLAEIEDSIPEDYRGIGLTVGILLFEENENGDFKLLRDIPSENDPEKTFDAYVKEGYEDSDTYLDRVNKTFSELESPKYKISGIYECWFDNNKKLKDKIEKYELILELFYYEEIEDKKIRIFYKLKGKGLLPKVSISNTDILLKPISFDTLYSEEIVFNSAGKYELKISATDILGTKFTTQVPDTIIYNCGEVEINNINVSQITGLSPQARNYIDKKIYLSINYNTSAIENLSLYLNDSELRHFDEDKTNFSGYISIGNNFNNGINEVYIKYRLKQTLEEKLIHITEFYVLNPGEFGILIGNIPDGYIGSKLIFDVTIQYGGPLIPGETSDVSKTIDIMLLDKYGASLSINLERTGFTNDKLLILFSLPLNLKPNNYSSEVPWEDLYIIKVTLRGDDSIYNTKNVIIKESVTKHEPYGQIYFNSLWSDILPTDVSNMLIHSTFPTQSGQEWQWRGGDETVLTCSGSLFNLDLYYITPQDGTNDTIIEITSGWRKLRINKLSLISITSDSNIGSTIFSNESLIETYLKEIYLPQNLYVHLGYGCCRSFKVNEGLQNEKIYYYDCIFINGEVIYISRPTIIPPSIDNTIEISFKDQTINILEFCLSIKGEDTYGSNNKDCVTLGGEGVETYNIIENSLFDVFYYNYKIINNTNLINNSVTKLKLITFTNTNSDNSNFWQLLKSLLPNLGSPIKKLENFCKFGEINKAGKPGITYDNPYLFNFTKSDKEDYGRDKLYGVLCRYSLGDLPYDENKFCIVQVQGTSTLAYPVPNFLFTFIKYTNVNGTYTFELDDSVDLTYTSPILNLGDDLSFEQKHITIEETNLVAKADSMDSAHLNNTPTCIYFNSLIDAINSDPNNFENFERFNDDFLDAIVGFPILIEIFEDSTTNFNSTIQNNFNFNKNFKSYGTFMLNIGKSASNLGMDEEKIYSLEGQSNQESLYNGSPGLFMLPDEDRCEAILSNETDINYARKNRIINSIKTSTAFLKLLLVYNNDDITLNDNELSNFDKYLISNFLISSESFESRSKKIDDDDMRITSTNKINELNKKDCFIVEKQLLINDYPDLNSIESALSYIDENYNNIIENIIEIVDDNHNLLGYKFKYLIFSEDDNENIFPNGYINKIENKWNTLKPFLIMWLFVATSDNNEFSTYFPKVFNLDYAILYYINLVLFAQVDNLGKNMMLDMDNRESSTNKKWYVRPYDLDSELGLTNNGFEIVPVYECISLEHFSERYNSPYPSDIYKDTVGIYNSANSILWTKFWKNFKNNIETYYTKLREFKYLTSDKIINVGKTVVSDLISKEQYNIDFYLKYFGTEFIYLCKGGRFNNYLNWITRRFMYVDSYFSYFQLNKTSMSGDSVTGYYWKIGPTLVPTFYEAIYQRTLDENHYYGQYDNSTYDENTGKGKFIGEGPITTNQLYGLKIVPESIVYMSPIFPGIEVEKLVNLLNYTGIYNKNILNSNVRDIEFNGNGGLNISSVIIGGNVTNLKLTNITVTESISFKSDSTLEELYISNCTIPMLSIKDLKLLKTLIIENSTINNLTIQNLNLKTFKIDYLSEILQILLGGSITSNKKVDLSGFKGSSVNIDAEGADIEEFYIDLIYNINEEICTIYDDFQIISRQQHKDKVDLNQYDYNATINGINVDWTNLGRGKFKKINPIIESLDLTRCNNLKVVSCVGCSSLRSLKVPTTVEQLNVLFCIKLSTLNSNESGIFNFSNFSNLKSKKCFIVSKGYNSKNSSYSGFLFIHVKSIPSTFNLIGTAVEKLLNLNHENLNSNFTGEYFVTGCIKLNSIENCKLEFKSASHSFKFTKNFNDITFLNNELFSDTNCTEGFYLSLSNNINIEDTEYDTEEEEDIEIKNSNISYGFLACGLNSTSLKNLILSLANKSISADNAFLGTEIVTDIDDGNGGPLTINWTSCQNTFSTPIYAISYIDKSDNTISYSGIEVSDTNDYSYNFEFLCLGTVSAGFTTNAFNNNTNKTTKTLKIKLPQTISVYRMFMGLSIKIDNINVFDNNTLLKSASTFLANTRQQNLIDFRNCDSLTKVDFCYSNTKIEQTQINLTTKLMFPTSQNSVKITHMRGLFLNTDLSDVDVKGILSTGISNSSYVYAQGCFRNTNCQCTGNPFTLNGNKRNNLSNTIDISSMFATSGITYSSPNALEKIDWTDNKMKTSSLCLNNYNSLILGTNLGVFEGRIIDKLPLVIENNGESLYAMFRNCEISNGTEYNDEINFTITAKESSYIFYNTKFKSFEIIIKHNNIVENLNYSLYNDGEQSIKFYISNNNIKELNYFCSQSINSNINSFNIEIIFINNDVSLNKLTTAKGMFSNTQVKNSNIPEDLFRGCNILTNISELFKNCSEYHPVNEFKLDDCKGLKDMSYSFYYSGINKLPILPSEFLNLLKIKSAFRGITLIYASEGDKSYNITAKSLLSEIGSNTEIFAESIATYSNGNKINLTININSDSLADVSAFSTNTSINLKLTTKVPLVKALLINNVRGGNIEVFGNSNTQLIYTNNGWNEVECNETSQRCTPTDVNYIMTLGTNPPSGSIEYNNPNLSMNLNNILNSYNEQDFNE